MSKEIEKVKEKNKERGMKAIVLAVHHAQQQEVTQTGFVIAKRQKSVKLLGWLKWREANIRLQCYFQYRIRGRNFTSKY